TEIDPFSTFSLNISDVSFRLAMAALQRGQAPARAAIRSEEFVNAFDYRDPPPEPGEAVALHWETARVPWLHDRWLVRFSVAAGETGRPPEEPLNLTVLLDNSGSMKRADRQEIVAASVNALAPLVRPQDRLNAVTFARRPQLVAENFAGSEAPRFVERLLKQVPEGGTNLEAALDLAYAVTARNRVAGQNRIVLLTDGAANLGNVEPERLRDMAVEGRQQAIALDAFGVGWEGYEDATLEALTRNSDGRYAFLTDSLHARRDFAERLAGALQVAAKNVKVQIEWNPDRVTRFRQIGYERHRLATEDFRNNTVDAAEIARAESGTALYVIEVDEAGIGPLGTLRVRYQEPASGLYREREWTLMPPRRVPPLDEASPAIRLAATAAFFAEKLAGLPSASAYDLRDLDELATGLSTSFDSPQVQQLINALRRARLLNGE
ncbi:MAG: von Willebrand factor type A domain-containing protein, partial [Opitutales bacterium]